MSTTPQSAQPVAPVAQQVAVVQAEPAVQATQPEQAASAIVLPPSPDVVQAVPALVAGKKRRPRNDPEVEGLTAGEVDSIPTMRAIWKEHYEKGLSHKSIEKNPKHGLRQSNGMTVYRICRNYEKATGTKRPTSE